MKIINSNCLNFDTFCIKLCSLYRRWSNMLHIYKTGLNLSHCFCNIFFYQFKECGYLAESSRIFWDSCFEIKISKTNHTKSTSFYCNWIFAFGQRCHRLTYQISITNAISMKCWITWSNLSQNSIDIFWSLFPSSRNCTVLCCKDYNYARKTCTKKKTRIIFFYSSLPYLYVEYK